MKTHGGVVRDLEDKFALRWFPFYAVAGLEGGDNNNQNQKLGLEVVGKNRTSLGDFV